MFRHILVPTDGSDQAQAAVVRAIEIAKEISAQITVLTVSEPFYASIVEPMRVTDTAEIHDRQAEVNAATVLGRAKVAASAANVNCSTIHLQHDSVYRAIIETADQRGCDLIVMTWPRRHTMLSHWHESKTVRVLKYCTVPVLVL
ncbi:hypothetical protein AU467_22515 [Mesorhizobium loti]|uniref:UspA domain-containing protein n=1 Tax=Rhizobium loti TaxID=381 RepID=A0A117N3L7_RHILI|nr:hypothetical protein AU467_22515 [Mesorhizobium loti]